MSGIEPANWAEPDEVVYLCEYCLAPIHEDDVPERGDVLCEEHQPEDVTP